MKYFLKNYMLFLIAMSFVLTPVGSGIAKTAAESQFSEAPIQVAKLSKRKKVTIRKSKRRASYKRARARKARLQKRRIALAKQRAIDLGEHYDGSVAPQLASAKALVVNQNTGEVKYAKNSSTRTPIASITKLMTAMVVLDAQQPMNEMIYISENDVDTIKGTRSRLPVGSSLQRSDMLQLALMSSENRAAFALSSNYPGGRPAFVEAMNAKAFELGLENTHFAEPTGLMYQNTSTAEDLYVLVAAAYQYPEIRSATTTIGYEIYIDGNEHFSAFKNTNSFVRKGTLDIGLSKTGYINEAGRCLVMQTMMGDEPMIVVLLDAAGTNKRTGDVNRLRKWFAYGDHQQAPVEQVPAESGIVVVEKTGLEPKLVMSDSIVAGTIE